MNGHERLFQRHNSQLKFSLGGTCYRWLRCFSLLYSLITSIPGDVSCLLFWFFIKHSQLHVLSEKKKKMEKGFVTGVVRNRKINTSAIQARVRGSSFSGEEDQSKYTEISNFMNKICCSFFLRIHKFQFEWALSFHIMLCIVALVPFSFSGSIWSGSIALILWLVYNGNCFNQFDVIADRNFYFWVRSCFIRSS